MFLPRPRFEEILQICGQVPQRARRYEQGRGQEEIREGSRSSSSVTTQPETDEESGAEGDSDGGEYDLLVERLKDSVTSLPADLPFQHLHEVLGIRDNITRPHKLPPDLQCIVSAVRRLGPIGSHRHRLQAMASARSLSERALGQDIIVSSGLDSMARQVLDAAGDGGAHPAFF